MLIIFAGIIRHGSAQINLTGNPSLTSTKSPPITHVGLGMESYLNGDAHGSFYSLSLNLKRKKAMLSFGPCIQKRSQELNSGKISISYLLTGLNENYDSDEPNEDKTDPSDAVELTVLLNLQYTDQGRLSYHASETETLTNPESNINYSQLRFSTVTATLGPEIDFNLRKLRIRTYAGASFFYHLNYPEGMYRPKYGPAIVLGFGISVPKL